MSLSRVINIDPQILSSGRKDLLKRRQYRIPYDLFIKDRIFSEDKLTRYFEERCFTVRKFDTHDRHLCPALEVLGFAEIHFVNETQVIYIFGELSIAFKRTHPSMGGEINRIRVYVQAEFNSVTLNMEDCYYYEEKISFDDKVNVLEYLRVWFLRELDGLDEDALGIEFSYEDDHSKKFGNYKSRIRFKFVNRGLTSTFDVGECDIPDRSTALAMVRKSLIVRLFDY